MLNPIKKNIFFNAITTSNTKTKTTSRDSLSIDKYVLLLYIKNAG